MKKPMVIAVLLTLVAFGFRLWLALRLANDEPGDAKIYALIARNVLDHQVYSSDEEEPLHSTYFRVPGYPLFLMTVYSVFGKDNNRAARVIQALVDTGTCGFVGLLALAWSPPTWAIEKRRRAGLWALALAALCPFTAIYVAVLLTEIWTMFWVMAGALAATYALKNARPLRAGVWWAAAGLAGGLATMFRPDSPLFVAGIGFTLTTIGLGSAFAQWRHQRAIHRAAPPPSQPDLQPPANSAPSPGALIGRTMLGGTIFSTAFLLALMPWTLRNERVFKVFMPIAPASASMPDEFVPAGYNVWLRTWVDNWFYTEKADWAMGERPILVEQLPAYAFDSEEEKAEVAELLSRYNNPEAKPQPTVEPEDQKQDADDDDDSSGDDDEDNPSANDEGSDEDEEAQPLVQMTPEIDAEFAQIARRRIQGHPFRYYVLTPLKRARHMWFSTHSQYYPFSGDDLFPSDSEHHQQFWLPLFKSLVWLFTIFSFAGAILLWRNQATRRWVLLVALLIMPRFVYLTTLQNPEPRYVVEFFPFVLAVAGLALASLTLRRKYKIVS